MPKLQPPEVVMVEVVLLERDPTLGLLYLEELSGASFKVRVRANLEGAYAALRTQPAHILVSYDNSTGSRPKVWPPRLRQVHKGPVRTVLPALGPAPGGQNLGPEPANQLPTGPNHGRDVVTAAASCWS